ncbi:MAG: PQQ-binding-like beta-propeller repeat protein [archaeon]
MIKEKWKFDIGSSLLSPPIICDLTNTGHHSILTATKDGKVFLLDFEGNEKWVFDAKEHVDTTESMFFDSESANSILSTPQICDITGNKRKEVIFGTEMGVVYALDAYGHPLWKFHAGGSVRGALAVGDVNGDGQQEIIFGSGDKHLYILNTNGRLIRKIEVGCKIESTPETMGDKIIFGCDDGTIRCINYEGHELWRFETDAKVIAKPVITRFTEGGTIHILIGSMDHYLYALDEYGELIWKFKTEGAIYSRVTLADINRDKKLEILFGSCDNNVYALKNTGDKIWSFETGFWVVAPIVINDIDEDGRLEVIACSFDHNIYILDARGNYVLDYVPGLAGVMQQTGSYSDVMTSDPGKITAKKLWQFQTDGVVVGCEYTKEGKNIIVNTRRGIISNLGHVRGD